MYAYDVEVLYNFFSVIFIELEDENIPAYIEADINKDEALKKEILTKIKHRKFIIFHDIFGENKANRNDAVPLRKFLRDNTTTIFGYNNKHYDDYVISFIENYTKLVTVQEITQELYKLSQELIHYDGYNFIKDSSYTFGKFHRSIDLMKLNYLDKKRISLKQVSIALKWYRVEDYTMPDAIEGDIKYYNKCFVYSMTLEAINKLKSFERIVKYENIEHLIEYNFNDVFITNQLYIVSKEELRQRVNVFNEYKVYVLSDSRSSIADKLLAKMYSDYTGLKYHEFSQRKTFRKVINIGELIVSNVKFQTKELNSFLGTLSTIKIRVGEDKLQEILLFNDVGYNFMMGGLHSIDRGGKFKSTDKIKYIEGDVDSFYPSVMINYGFKPRHLSGVILQMLNDVMQLRLEAKKSGDKDKAGVLKIVINAFWGKTGSKKSWLHDLNAMYSVTINGQLFLLMVIEDLELAGFKTISANTDGIVSKVPIERMKEYKQIWSNWEKKTRFSIGYNIYEKYIRTNVNSYIAQIEGKNELKKRSEFDDVIYLDKGYKYPIVSIAINKYVIDGISVEQTIKNHTDIYDFLISQKTGSQFVNQYHHILDGSLQIDTIQKNIRYYVSTSGGILIKHNKETGKNINILKGKTVVLFNNYFKVNNFSEYSINYNYYLARCQEILDRISNNDTKQIKKSGGSLFDEF